LCPSRKKRGGTANLNIELQKALNPEAKNKKQISFNGVIFREGDKIMQIRNNYDLEYTKDDGTQDIGVFNGDIGCIERIEPAAKTMQLRFEDRVRISGGYTLPCRCCKGATISQFAVHGDN
ncbi:MAG: hypothetical protein RR273_06980, partial [Oscillospiraceae bacterium]